MSLFQRSGRCVAARVATREVGVMVMKASVEDDDSGWELGIPEKMEKSNTNWVDITQDFEEAC